MIPLAGSSTEAAIRAYIEAKMAARSPAEMPSPPAELQEGEWDEGKHPRAHGGKFASKGEHALGITPFREGEDEPRGFYESAKWRAFNADLQRSAEAHHVRLLGVAPASGVWQGGREPSAIVRLRDGDDAVRAVADELGAKYDQDGVLRFKANGKGDAFRFVSAEKVDPEKVKVADALRALPGATVRPDGKLEVVAIDPADRARARALFTELGLHYRYHRGDAELRLAGDHYKRWSAQGRSWRDTDSGSVRGDAASRPAGARDGAGRPGLDARGRQQPDVRRAEDVRGEADDPGPQELAPQGWQAPPPPVGKQGERHGAGGYSSDLAYGTNTQLGRTGERAFQAIVGGDILHPKGKGEQSPLDVRFGDYGFEVKAVSTKSLGYKATPKPYEQAQKEQFARELGLHPALAIVVVDSDNGMAHAYFRDGLTGGRLSEKTGWRYLGSTELNKLSEAAWDEGHHPRGLHGRWMDAMRELHEVPRFLGQRVHVLSPQEAKGSGLDTELAAEDLHPSLHGREGTLTVGTPGKVGVRFREPDGSSWGASLPREVVVPIPDARAQVDVPDDVYERLLAEHPLVEHPPSTPQKALLIAMRVWRGAFHASVNMRRQIEGQSLAPAYKDDRSMHLYAAVLDQALDRAQQLGEPWYRLEPGRELKPGDEVNWRAAAIGRSASEVEAFRHSFVGGGDKAVLFELPPEAHAVTFPDGQEGIVRGHFRVESVAPGERGLTIVTLGLTPESLAEGLWSEVLHPRGNRGRFRTKVRVAPVPTRNWLGGKIRLSRIRRRGMQQTPLTMLVTTGQPDMDRFASPALGRLLVPGMQDAADATARAGVPFAADNGGFFGVPVGQYKEMVEKLHRMGLRPLWVTAPDVIHHLPDGTIMGDWEGTARRFEQWQPYLAHMGMPVALVAQNGLDSPEGLAWLDQQWDKIDAIFLGGNNDFKLGPGGAKITRLAQEHGKLVHMGRVSTAQRMAYARDVLGVDSMDGSQWAKFKDTHLGRGLSYASTGDAPPTRIGREWVKAAREARDGVRAAWPKAPDVHEHPQWPRGDWPEALTAAAQEPPTVFFQDLSDALYRVGLSDYWHLHFTPGRLGFTVDLTDPRQPQLLAGILGLPEPEVDGSVASWPGVGIVPGGGDEDDREPLQEAPWDETHHHRGWHGRFAPGHMLRAETHSDFHSDFEDDYPQATDWHQVDLPTSGPGWVAPEGVEYSPEVKAIGGWQDAERYLRGRGLTTVALEPPDTEKGRNLAKDADWFRQIAQAITDAQDRYPALRTGANPLTTLVLYSNQPNQEALATSDLAAVWAVTGRSLIDPRNPTMGHDPPLVPRPSHTAIVINDHVIGLQDRGSKYNIALQGLMSHASVSLYGKMMHELGHAVAAATDFSDIAHYMALRRAHIDPVTASAISEYGASAPAELWAEVFATINTDSDLARLRGLHPDAAARIDELRRQPEATEPLRMLVIGGPLLRDILAQARRNVAANEWLNAPVETVQEWDEARHHRGHGGRFLSRLAYEPDLDAPREGEWVREPDPSGMFPKGITTDWRQHHDELVKAALRSWKGAPATMSLHMRDAVNGEPMPGSGSGKQMRRQAQALAWELAHKSRPNDRALYRGSEREPGGFAPWSELKSVAKGFAGKGEVRTLAKGEGRGIRIGDYHAGGSLDEAEREWIIDHTGDHLAEAWWEELRHPRGSHGRWVEGLAHPDVAAAVHDLAERKRKNSAMILNAAKAFPDHAEVERREEGASAHFQKSVEPARSRLSDALAEHAPGAREFETLRHYGYDGLTGEQVRVGQYRAPTRLGALYHVAPLRLRDTIASEGLRNPGERSWPMNDQYEPGLYAWDTLADARHYRDQAQGAAFGPGEPMDIWELHGVPAAQDPFSERGLREMGYQGHSHRLHPDAVPPQFLSLHEPGRQLWEPMGGADPSRWETMYHYTTAPRAATLMKDGVTADALGGGNYGRGFYVSQHPQGADDAYGPVGLRVKVRVANPLVVDGGTGSRELKGVEEEVRAELKAAKIDPFGREWDDRVTAKLKARGYDGVHVPGGTPESGGDYHVVFDPAHVRVEGKYEPGALAEAAIDHRLAGVLRRRFPKGARFGGRFMAVGQDSPAVAHLRQALPRWPEPPAVTRLQRRGVTRHIRGVRERIPEQGAWRVRRGGHVFSSPVGSTLVYRDGQLAHDNIKALHPDLDPFAPTKPDVADPREALAAADDLNVVAGDLPARLAPFEPDRYENPRGQLQRRMRRLGEGEELRLPHGKVVRVGATFHLQDDSGQALSSAGVHQPGLLAAEAFGPYHQVIEGDAAKGQFPYKGGGRDAFLLGPQAVPVESPDRSLRARYLEASRDSYQVEDVLKPQQLRDFGEATRRVTAEFPEIVGGEGDNFGAVGLGSIEFLSGLDPASREELTGFGMVASTAYAPGWKAQKIILNDLEPNTLGEDPNLAPSTRTWQGAATHELGHAFARWAGLGDQGTMVAALEKFDLGVGPMGEVSVYAAADPREGFGELFGMRYTPGFHLPPETAARFDRMIEWMRTGKGRELRNETETLLGNLFGSSGE